MADKKDGSIISPITFTCTPSFVALTRSYIASIISSGALIVESSGSAGNIQREV